MRPGIPGAPSLTDRVVQLGYERVVCDPDGRGETAKGFIEEVLTSPAYLVPGFLRVLDVEDRRLADAYYAVLADPGAVRTVDGWGRLLGFQDRHGIERLHRERGVGGTWEILAWLRLVAVVEWASRLRERPTVTEVAQRFKYASGAYLNERAEKLSGRKFPELVELGPEGALEAC